MKRITIKKALEQYDSNKGYGRTLIKEEPHIKELRSFYVELKEEDLSPSSLLKLARILIGKNTRTDTSESGKTFEELVNALGGYEALDTLNAAKELTEDNVVFLEKHPKEAKALASNIVFFSKNTAASAMKNIFNAAEKMKNPQELILIFKELELISQRENAVFFIDALSLLNRHGLNSDEVIPLLKESEHIIFIVQILKTLVKSNPALITMPNLISILQIKKPYIFLGMYKNLPPNQKSLDSLYHANDTLDQCIWSQDILKNFKTAEWDPQPYLQAILSGKLNGWALTTATTKLVDLKLKAEIVPLILSTTVTHSNESVELVKAVNILNKEGLDEDLLKLAFGTPKFSNTVAAALTTLQKAQCYTKTSQTFACFSPEYALGLAQFWIQFSRIECSEPSLRINMLKHPQCASYTANVIEFLRQHELHIERNISVICNAKLTSDALFNLLNVMNEAKILDQTSLDHLFPKLSFIKTLYSSAKCLANGKKLDSFNFDTLISDPINAVALAENLGGKSYKELAYLKNPGAQDFVTIRRNTKILCQGHRQGLFFPEMSAEKKLSFEKYRGMTLAAVQKEILIKIAKYSGNRELEEEVEHHIANVTYSSFLKAQ